MQFYGVWEIKRIPLYPFVYFIETPRTAANLDRKCIAHAMPSQAKPFKQQKNHLKYIDISMLINMGFLVQIESMCFDAKGAQNRCES